MRGRTFDSCSYDGGGGGGGSVEATGFSGSNVLQPSEEQRSVPTDSREVGCVPLCSAICARPRSCCASLEIPSRPECLNNGFLSHGSEGGEANGSAGIPNLRGSDVFTSRDQTVQSVIKLGDGEIQVQVIGSDLSLKRDSTGCIVQENGELANVSEEKPQKRKKKFIIILKGLLNKSGKSDRKKQIDNVTDDNEHGIVSNRPRTKVNVESEKGKKNRLGGKNKSETNLSRIKECCVGNVNNYKSENNITFGNCEDCDHNQKCLISSYNSIDSNNCNHSKVNSGYNRRKFTGTTVDTQEQLTLLYYAALTGNPFKENGEREAICQGDVVGGSRHTEEEEEEEVEQVPEPADAQPPCDVILEDHLKEDNEDIEVPVIDINNLTSSDCVSFKSSEESLNQSEGEDYPESSSDKSLELFQSAEVQELEDFESSDSCVLETLTHQEWFDGSTNNCCESAPLDDDDDSVCDSSIDSCQTKVEESSSSDSSNCSCSSDQISDTNAENEYLPEIVNVDNKSSCDINEECTVDCAISSCIETYNSNLGIAVVRSENTYSENSYNQHRQEISEDEIDPWGQGTSCDFSSESDQSDSSSDSSVDYDVPPVDDYIYDLQFDPYFYQGSLSLEDIPDDQPIEYPCPYDTDGRLIKNQIPQYNSHFPYIDNHSYNPITNPGDLYRSQSQPEDISRTLYEDTPLDGNAPLHVFLSQPIPNQVPDNFPPRNCQLKPRKRGEFSSLCSFGGSQLYTITEEAEWDPLEEDIYSRRQYSDGEFYTRRNYSESDIYQGYDDGSYEEPYSMNSDLYYGDTDTDTDSDETIHSESSRGCISTETLEREGNYLRDLSNRIYDDSRLEIDFTQEETDQESCSGSNSTDVICEEQLSEFDSDSDEEIENSVLQVDGDVLELSQEDISVSSEEGQELPYHENSEGTYHTEYPDEFFLFCSEAEITDMEVMETVDVLPYNGSKEDFSYFKVEDKTSRGSSPIDPDFLMENYNYTSNHSIAENHIEINSKTTSDLPNNLYWEHQKINHEKMSSTPIYQNIPINSRLSKSNPNLAALVEDLVPAKPIYQNVPVPSKRYHLPATGQLDLAKSKVYSNSDEEFDYLDHTKDQYQFRETRNHSSKNERNGRSFHKKDLHEPSARPLSKDDNDVQSTLHKWSRKNWRNADLSSFVSSGSSGANQRWQSIGERDHPAKSPAEFNAYASNTSLDYDTFSKTSKIYKWNGSSSVSDLTSLSRDLCPTSPGVARTSASTSDLTRIGGGPESLGEDEDNQELMSETSYAAWSAKVQNDFDDQEFVLPLNMKNNTSSYSFTPHGKSGSRAMMEFYVNTLTSDSDSDNDSSTASSSTSASGGSHDLEEEEHVLERTYQVMGCADTVLDTIEEDVEEDSGAESSGHWMFSADSTDTDSVIHVPAILDLRPYPVEAVKEAESTDSDSTLIVEEEEDVNGVCCTEVAKGNSSSSEQEAGVTEGNSHVGAPATDHHHHFEASASDEADEDSDSRGVDTVVLAGGSSSNFRAKTRRRREGDNSRRKKNLPLGDAVRRGLPRQANMLSRNEAAKLFEKHIDDVFDFESLESCESVYGGNDDTSYPSQGCTSPLAGEEVVFNTSATSQPFADASRGMEADPINSERIGEDVVDFSKDAGEFIVNQRVELHSKDGEGSLPLPQAPTSHDITPLATIHDPHAHGEIHYDSESSEFDLNKSANSENTLLDQTYIIGNSECQYEKENTISNVCETPVSSHTPVTNLSESALTSVNVLMDSKMTENDCDENQIPTAVRASEGLAFTHQSSEPISMDLFGLPVRWTEGEKKKSPAFLNSDDIEIPVAPYACKIQKICKTNLEPLTNNDSLDRNNDDVDNFKYDDMKTHNDMKFNNDYNQELARVTKASLKDDSDHDVCENEKVTATERVAVSEGDFTFTSSSPSSSSSSSSTLAVSETSGEAHHYQATTGNLLQSSACHRELSVFPSVAGDGEGASRCITEPLRSENQDDSDRETITMRDHSTSDSKTLESHKNYPSTLTTDNANEPQQPIGVEPQYVKTQRHIENFSSRYYEGEIKNDGTICQQHPSLILQGGDVRQYGTDLPSGNSDTDTDNTDGDYDEEDHFAAELSLRISTVHSEGHSGVGSGGSECRSFRNTDILSVLTATGGKEGAGHEDATGSVSPLASQEGSSPEMPDSLRSSEGRSGTRSIETLSEDSGLGDRDVRLTPSSPLPSISEGGTRGAPSSSQGSQQSLSAVTARPRRQDIRQARIARARSCSDLRVYSDSSDTDTEEENDMHGWHSRSRGGGTVASNINGTAYNGGTYASKPFKSSYANYLQEQYRGEGENVHERHFDNLHPTSPPSRYQHLQRSHPLSGSDGSDEEIKSRYRRVRETSANNYSRPRRYKSLLEFPSKEDYYNASQNSGSDFYKDTQRVPRGVGSAQPRGSRRRREPLSVDLAEEFLSQELQTSKSKHDDKRNGDAIRVSGDKLPGDRGPPSASSRGGAGDEASYHMSVTNQIARSELKTNGVEVGGVLRGPQGSWGEEGLAGCKDEGRADVRVQCGWPHASTTAAAVATAPTAPYPHHHPLDAHHQPPSPPHLTPSSSQRQPQHQYSSSSPAQLPNECQPVRTGHSGNTAPPHDPFAQSDPSTNLPQQEEQEQPFVVTRKATSNDPIQTVQEDNNMAEVPVRVRTKTYGSHGEVEVYLARADSGRPPPHPAASASSPVLTPTGGVEHRTGSRGVTFSPSVKEVNWRESYYEVDPEGDDVIHPTKSTSEVESSRKTPNRVETGDVMQQQEETRPFPIAAMHPNNNTTTGKINGSSFDPSTGSSSEAELGEEKGQQQKSSTPIWQRFKLPKISSPKSPRPKILPKPTSLSPRSSDTEISNPMSPDSSSSTPSSPDSKLKKTPQSPKFFSWGSKREKKPREITRPTTAPPPVPPQPPQVSAGQGGGGGGSRGGQTGEPDSPSVTLTALNREGRGDAPLIISAKKNQVITSDSSEDRVVRSALAKRHVHKSVPSTLTTSASSSNNSGKEEEEELDRRSQSVSSSGDDTADTRGSSSSSSPRSAVAKPPLPPHLQRPTQQAFHKARLLSARRHYFSQERQVSSSDRVSPPKDNTTDAQDGPSVAHPAAHTRSAVTSAETVTPTLSSFRASPPRAKPSLLTKGSFDSSKNLKERFERFSASTRAERERLARSTPDLSVIRASVRRPGQRIDSCTRGGADEQQQQATSAAADIHVAASPASASDGEASNRTNAHQGATHTQSKPRQAIHERYKNRAQRIYARSRTQSTGVLETDLDTGASRELLTLRETNLDDLYKDLQHLLNTLPSVGGPTPTETKARAKSLLDLEAASSDMEGQLEPPTRPPDTRAKSMEFLLDDGNKAAVQPPENELMKGSERQLSEAELRVRRSLQRLDVPEWMKNAQPQQQGFLLRRRDYGSSSMTGGGGGWSAFSSKTASMTSLGSSRAHTPNTPTKVVIPTRVASKGTTGLGGLTSPASNASISPSPSDRSGSLFQYPSSRWSTSRLNSGTTTPTGSVTSTRTTPATYVRQPYLGWRSQTSLASLAGSQSSLTNTGTYLTAADRLALGITSYSQRFVKPPPVSAQDKENSSAQANAAVTKSGNEEMNDEASTNGNIKLQVPTDVADVHSSIKEVTSAIVHYCNESTPSPRASPRGSPRPEGPRAPSPRRLVWVESSFVGSRPITSPETPTSSTHAITPTSQLNGHEEPESNEAPSQPPQPPGEYLLAW